jgi:hypothetical protein
MELNYWEKQLILYTKGHFGRTDYDKDLKRFPAELYGLSLEHTDNYNVLGMVVRLYQKLVDTGHIHFTLEKFIADIFKRASFERSKNEVAYQDVLRQMLAEFQGLQVRDDDNVLLDLETADEDLKAIIAEEIKIDQLPKKKVKYIGGMDFYDGLTTCVIYEVIDENETQYIVNNDLGATSKIQKSKFEVQ